MSWKKVTVKGAVPEARHSAAMCVVGGGNNTLALYGGTIEGKAFDDLRFLNTATWEWRVVGNTSGDRPKARWGHTMHTFDGFAGFAPGFLLYGGKEVEAGFTSDVFLFDPATLAWCRPPVKGCAPPPRAYHAAAVAGNVLFVIGGEPAPDVGLYALHLDTMTWESVPVSPYCPEPRKKAALCYNGTNGVLYFYGGAMHSTHEFTEDLHIFDPRNSTWTEAKKSGAVPPARSGHTMDALGQWVVVYGGLGAKCLTFTEIHHIDVDSPSWFKRKGMGMNPPERHMHCSAPISKTQCVIFGGVTDRNVPLNDTALLDVSSIY